MTDYSSSFCYTSDVGSNCSTVNAYKDAKLPDPVAFLSAAFVKIDIIIDDLPYHAMEAPLGELYVLLKNLYDVVTNNPTLQENFHAFYFTRLNKILEKMIITSVLDDCDTAVHFFATKKAESLYDTLKQIFTLNDPLNFGSPSQLSISDSTCINLLEHLNRIRKTTLSSLNRRNQHILKNKAFVSKNNIEKNLAKLQPELQLQKIYVSINRITLMVFATCYPSLRVFHFIKKSSRSNIPFDSRFSCYVVISVLDHFHKIKTVTDLVEQDLATFLSIKDISKWLLQKTISKTNCNNAVSGREFSVASNLYKVTFEESFHYNAETLVEDLSKKTVLRSPLKYQHPNNNYNNYKYHLKKFTEDEELIKLFHQAIFENQKRSVSNDSDKSVSTTGGFNIVTSLDPKETLCLKLKNIIRPLWNKIPFLKKI